MYYTYVLLCIDVATDSRKLYTGYSTDLDVRVLSHRYKSTQTTKNFDKIELIYFEACLNKTDAIRRERQLKTGFGRGYLKRRLEMYFKNKRV